VIIGAEEPKMRWIIAVLSVAGIVVSSLALAQHYGPAVDPNAVLYSNWNSAYVNHSPYADVFGIPVAVLGIVGYALLAALALRRRVLVLVYLGGMALAYTLYLTNIEAHVLRLWCVYCMCSLIVSVLILFLAFGWLIFGGAPDESHDCDAVSCLCSCPFLFRASSSHQ
jgi:vitamin-K-epoxide reductase (warfarin-sensitive)